MILFQVRDLAAHSCGEPHVAPSWEIAKASLGAMLAKTPELAQRAHSIRIEHVCAWDPEFGVGVTKAAFEPYDMEDGDVCLSEFRAACRREEDVKQAEADGLDSSNENKKKDQDSESIYDRNHRIMLEHAAKEEDDE